MVNLIAAEAEAAHVQRYFSHEIRIIADLRIPMSDGRHLSARMWLPVDAEDNPVPAVIEYAPFRHRDFTYPRDAIIHPWFAGHGYASIRLETAGAMDSDGAPLDEYVPQEQADCVEALAWIAAQSWCSGTTGMFGMSWGAFSALQVAACRPPSLKAIIPVHGTDDRFADDVHYMGGCMLNVNLGWGALYQTYMARPPFKDGDEKAWLEAWKARMMAAPNILEAWVTHQNRDDYWRHASVCEAYENIEAATFVICGWADGYTNAALRMADGLTCPNRFLIGPWAHTYPHIALPGPQIGFLQEATRWWDRWLKDTDNGVEREARVVFYLQEGAPPAPSYTHRGGRWIAQDAWPGSHVEMEDFAFGAGALRPVTERAQISEICTPLTNALNGWEWLPHGVGPEMPLDQREEDAGALCYTSEPLEDRLEICGTPLVSLRLRSDTPRGTICVRLSDVAPDGAATLISYHVLNLMHRDGFETAQDVPVGAWIDVAVPLNAVAQSVASGHRLRVSISTQSWPLTWPSRDNMTLSVDAVGSKLTLPLRRLEAPDGEVPDLAPVRMPPPAELTWHRDVARKRTITRDLESGTFARSYIKDDGCFVVDENNQKVDSLAQLTYSIKDGDPLSACADLRFTLEVGDADRPVQLDGKFRVTADAEVFDIKGCILARYDGEDVLERVLDTRVQRIAF